MILQALYEYSQRKNADIDNTDIAPTGWQWKEIPFLLVLNTQGILVQIDDCRESDKKNRARRFLVPQEVTRSSGIAANTLWDKPAYIWGFDPKGKPERLIKQRQAFLDAIRTLPEDIAIQAVLTYLSNPDSLTQAKQYSQWKIIEEVAPFIAMRLEGDIELICSRPKVKEALNARLTVQEDTLHGTCLVTGKVGDIKRLHTAIKGVPGAQTSGAPLISFNKPAFYSYGKESGDIAPVSALVEDGYTKALNRLLGKDSRQKLQYGNTTVIFWARKPGEKLEESLTDLLGSNDKDNPDKNTDSIESLMKSPHMGGGTHFSADDQFYVLGISPNAARLSIRFWLPTTVALVQEKLRQYFNEIKLIGGKVSYPPLRSLLSSLALEYKLSNLSPLLEGAMIQSIIGGTDYPEILLTTALRRMRAEQHLPHLRAALIKAYLNRNAFKKHLIKKEISMSLDENHPDNAYHLGRLFAVLEKIQEEALPGINATIRERYFGAASTRPKTVFPILIKLHIHHLAKLENRGRATNFEKMVTRIIGNISQYESIMSLENQGLFAIGYYHQRQDLFTSKTEKQEQQAA